VSRLLFVLILIGLLLTACARSVNEQKTPTSDNRPIISATPIHTLLSSITATVLPTERAGLAASAASTPQPTTTPSRSPTQVIPASDNSDALVHVGVENIGKLHQLSEFNFKNWELVTALAWSPDGDALAISAGNFIRVYRPWSGEQIAELQIEAYSYGLEFDPTGSWLAVGSRDGFLRVWSIPALFGSVDHNIEPYLTLQAHKKGVNSIAFSPDGSVLASGGSDAIARFWDTTSGELLGSVIGGTFVVPAISFMPQGKTIAVVNGEAIRLRDIETESILGTFLAETSLYSLAFDPDGDWLAAGGTDNRIRLWHSSQAFRSGQETYPEPVFLDGHSGQLGGYQALIWQVLFSPDGRLLASAGGDGTIRIWNPNVGTLLFTLDVHNLGATSLAFHPDGLALASGGLDSRVVVWGIIDSLD
jgi:WD40 repeat protein